MAGVSIGFGAINFTTAWAQGKIRTGEVLRSWGRVYLANLEGFVGNIAAVTPGNSVGGTVS